jgi:hypothetical protein
MQVAVDLLVDGRRREPVARVLAPEPSGEVDVLPAVDVPEASAFGALDDQGRRGDPARDPALARRADPFARSLFRCRH